MFNMRMGIRGRVLSIAVAPCVAILVLGIGGACYFVGQGSHARNWVASIRRTTDQGTELTEALQQERRLTMLDITGDHQAAGDLAAARAHVDATFAALRRAPNPLAELDPSAAVSSAATYAPLYLRLPSLRQQVDAASVPATDAYQFYNQLTGLSLAGMSLIAHTAPNAATSVAESRARELFYAAEALSRAVALSGFALVPGTTPPQLTDFGREVGYYRLEIDNLLDDLQGESRTRLEALRATPAWKRLEPVEVAIAARGAPTDTDTDTDPGEPDIAGWQADALTVSRQLLDLYRSQQNAALDVAAHAADAILRDSLIAAACVLAVAVAAALVALGLSNRLTRRLELLRRDTLDLADVHLPRIVARLQHGEPVDLDLDVRRLDYGRDEIGQVGEAFNKAQLVAVSAAVTETRTRQGVKAVFVNIAHRSQLVMHRLLEVLDEAQYATDSPAQLELLFRLDHLATRERRNAENLIILGGERPGRRWPVPVSLTEIVRGAIAETEDYHKVRAFPLPELSIIGSVVADVVHLLAELIDNATSFSPPRTQVDITGGVVGRGVVIEISDQGLGMAATELDRVNRNLADPPDFSVDTLSSDSRLGLFVVARLARQNDIAVRLTESVYDGIRAIVVIPKTLIADGRDALPSPPSASPSETRTSRAALRIPTPADFVDPAGPAESTGRPPLPHRSRKPYSPAPAAPGGNDDAPARDRSPEQARDLLSAIETGTRRGRHNRPAQ
jgi:signal transduction histidine kinase